MTHALTPVTPPPPAARRERLARGLLALPSFAVAALVGSVALVLVRHADLDALGMAGLGNLLHYLGSTPEEAGREGGIGPMLAATGWVLLIALAVAVPLGLAGAVALSEVLPPRHLATRALRLALDVLAGLPSIVVGLFGLSLFCEALGLGWSMLSGGLAVATMIVPLFTRIAEEGLRAVPQELRRAGAALGLPLGTVVLRLVLPAAAPSLGAGLLLAAGRVLAESAALLLTTGGAIRMPTSPADPGRVLAQHVYQLAIEVPGGQARACSAAIVLIVVVALSTTVARLAPGWFRAR